MSFEQLIGFLLITYIYMMTPGPAAMNSIYNGIQYGAKKSVLATFGNISAFFLMVMISATSIGVLLSKSILFYDVLKVIGLLYLIYIGIRLWFTSDLLAIETAQPSQNQNLWTLYKKAFLITATNPKALIYITAILPQFLQSNQPLIPQFLFLGACIAVLQFLAFGGYALLASVCKVFIEKPQFGRIFNKVSGLIFIGFGVMLGLSNPKEA